MDIYAAINTRRTVREFLDKKITDEVLLKIINAGLQAPSNDHKRSWEFAVVDDERLKKEIIGAIDNIEDVEEILDDWGLTDRIQKEMYRTAIPLQRRMLTNSGRLIIPFFKQDTPLLEPSNLSALNSFASIWCCIENILLASASEGIFGVTRIPSAKEQEIVRMKMLPPDNYVFPCFLSLGYPKQCISEIEQIFADANSKLHFNIW